MTLSIVVDVMGADRPPRELVAGAVRAGERMPVHLILAGRRQDIEPHLPPAAPVEVLHCDGVVAPDAHPVEAVRDRTSSIVRGLEAVAEGKAAAFLSPGNTGAVVAAALLVLGRLPGILRPGLCAALPTLAGPAVLLIDAGATADPKPQHLVQFADMGITYAREVLGIASPTLGLLNIGVEPGKGDKLVRAAHEFLAARDNFVGNVEPHTVLVARPADVLVTGGFAGNLFLKAVEGGAEVVWLALRTALSRSPRAKAGAWLARPSLREVARKLRYEGHNGAPLLGVNGLVMAAHGRSDASAIEAAVERTFLACQAGLVDRIKAAIPAVD
ncbi:MAG: phosphate acyltransferase PlsX [Candidatus Acetothermia bacterium]|nr:phosphate acyltransferase PlsX [Candidatus Acetothermia bacterium]